MKILYDRLESKNTIEYWILMSDMPHILGMVEDGLISTHLTTDREAKYSKYVQPMLVRLTESGIKFVGKFFTGVPVEREG